MKNIISKQGPDIHKEVKKTKICMRYEPQKYPFLSHNFKEHITRHLILPKLNMLNYNMSTNQISLSITTPAYKMFDSMRCYLLNSINSSSCFSKLWLDGEILAWNLLSKWTAEDGCSELIVSTSFWMGPDENFLYS